MNKEKYSHYYKNVSGLDYIDVYRVLDLFEVRDQTLGHAIKKLLVAGNRGSKDEIQDIKEAIDTLQRRLAMYEEDANRNNHDDNQIQHRVPHYNYFRVK